MAQSGEDQISHTHMERLLTLSLLRSRLLPHSGGGQSNRHTHTIVLNLTDDQKHCLGAVRGHIVHILNGPGLLQFLNRALHKQGHLVLRERRAFSSQTLQGCASPASGREQCLAWRQSSAPAPHYTLPSAVALERRHPLSSHPSALLHTTQHRNSVRYSSTSQETNTHACSHPSEQSYRTTGIVIISQMLRKTHLGSDLLAAPHFSVSRSSEIIFNAFSTSFTTPSTADSCRQTTWS